MKNSKLALSLSIEPEEAQVIIDNYFRAFPKLKAKMDLYLKEVKTTGQVTSKFGRVRHLPRVREIYKKYGDGILDYKRMREIAKRTYTSFEELKFIRKEYNNLLNNALNFPIQSAATSIVNRAAIEMSKRFIQSKLDAWVSLQIHDQIVVSCNDNCIHRVKEIVQDCMENTTKLNVLGWKPSITLEDGIQRTIREVREMF
jgi:DNA polymerase-1